jgi:hypothetical protein
MDARNCARQLPRFLILVAAAVGFLATFFASAQSCGIVQWGAGNGYPPGPYPSPDAACAVRNGDEEDFSTGYGFGATGTYSAGHIVTSSWQGAPHR